MIVVRRDGESGVVSFDHVRGMARWCGLRSREVLLCLGDGVKADRQAQPLRHAVLISGLGGDCLCASVCSH